jgi:hypothetical protein
MDQSEMEVLVKNIDERTTRIEQILPTLATKKDLERFATKKNLEPFATKKDIEEEGVRTRRHFDVVAEQIKSDVQLIAEGQAALSVRVDKLEQKLTADIAAHDKRLLRLEGAKRR